MRHGSLFSGIGGFDLASEWMGWDNLFHCEWNEFGQKILKYYWPKAKSYEDITKTDFSIWRGKIDILTGGFPCQPYSTSGKRLGTEDDRHLWPEMLRAIREIQPSYIVAENVLGLTNWNDGLVFNEVQTDLETEGYEVQPYVLPACSVNAPHRRDRVWFVAYSKDIQRNFERSEVEQPGSRGSARRGIKRNVSEGNATNSTGGRRIQNNIEQQPGKFEFSCPSWNEWPTQSPICHGDDGFSSKLDAITFPKWRSESIKAGGNAIVPQVAHQIFKAIEQYEAPTISNRFIESRV